MALQKIELRIMLKSDYLQIATVTGTTTDLTQTAIQNWLTANPNKLIINIQITTQVTAGTRINFTAFIFFTNYTFSPEYNE